MWGVHADAQLLNETLNKPNRLHKLRKTMNYTPKIKKIETGHILTMASKKYFIWFS